MILAEKVESLRSDREPAASPFQNMVDQGWNVLAPVAKRRQFNRAGIYGVAVVALSADLTRGTAGAALFSVLVPETRDAIEHLLEQKVGGWA